MANYIVLGAQWGDEGKGKIVDMLSAKMDMVVRFQGGANAGHTVKCEGKEYVLHLIPGGIVSGKAVNVIGNGCVVDPLTFIEEVDYLRKLGVEVTPEKLLVSSQAHVVTPVHKYLDRVLNKKIGTTGRGIGPAYGDKVHRTGIRLENIPDGSFIDRFREHAETYRQISAQVYDEPFIDVDDAVRRMGEAAERMKPYIGDSVERIAEFVRRGKNVLYEGAQGTFLDIDHGTYPFVTSSSTSIGGAFTGGGVFVEFEKRIGIVKAYTTRVGEGPFPTEQNNEIGERLRKNGHEFGATTGRPRRCGWLDLKMLKRSFIINGFNYVSLSKISCLSGFETLKVAVDYNAAGEPVYEELPGWREEVEGITEWNKLPESCRNYINFIEEYLAVPLGMISTGPDRKDIIYREKLI
ncbi:MAG TPA: adenylosuccinate synthase [Caldithrix abyssi]|uniref:Adenylosuccinate synthetase n=1 Tax=Caldithrix abyssi TaxID=187145 RepID=A0A7V4U1K0_CALAY|nr:adenylosuccinate synthase [Caldithrix abyssi]